MGHHIVDQDLGLGETRAANPQHDVGGVLTPPDVLAVPAIAVELLRNCIETPKVGRARQDQIRVAVRPICDAARKSQVMPEQLLISLKQLCHSLPEFERMRGAYERGAFLDEVVTLAIDEFYRT